VTDSINSERPPPPLTVSVPPVLRAIDRYSLLPLLPDGHARALAGPVALAVADMPLEPAAASAAARRLRLVAAILEPALAQAGSPVRLPEIPDPAPVRASSNPVRPPVLRIGQDGRIKVEQTPYALLDVCRSLPGARSVRRGGRHAWWSIPSSPAAALAAIDALRPFGVIYSRGVAELAEQVGRGASARARYVDGGQIPESDGTDVVNMPLWDHQRVAVGYAEEASALLLAIPMSGGKAITLSSRIATPSGWTTMGELIDGDEVFDERGEVCRVVTAHPVLYDRDCYDVVFSDGEVVRADGEHLWATWSRSDREKLSYHHRRGTVCPPLGAVHTTREIAATLRVGARGLSNHFLPVNRPLQLPDADLPVAPYTLGYWLGNGCTGNGQITTGAPQGGGVPDRDEIVAQIEADGFSCGRGAFTGASRTATTLTVHGLVADLRTAGVLGDKHIPPVYLRASEKQRRALLAGLLDSDGTVCPHGRVQFDSTREVLARGVLELMRTLGYRASISSKTARLNGRDHGTVWRVTFTTADADLFRLERKVRAHLQRAAGARNTGDSRNRWRSIAAVRPVPSEPVRCITVDSPSRLYLAGEGMIPTHNTAAAIAAINRRQAGRVLIVSPNKVRRVWSREARERSNVSWHISDGTREKRRGLGRVDLSAAQRFDDMHRVLYDCDCGAPTHCYVINYELLSLPGWRDWVPPYPLDAIVYDECQRLKAPTGAVSKSAARLVPFSRFRVGLSGTPAPQYWYDIFGVFRALDPGIFGEVWTRFKEQWVIMRQTRDGRAFPDPRRSTDDAALAEKFHSITYRPIVDLDLPAVTDVRREVELEPKARQVYDQLASELWTDLAAFLERSDQAAVAVDEDEMVPWEDGSDETGSVDWAAEPDGPDAPTEVSANLVLTRLLRLAQITGGSLTGDPIRDEDGRIITPGRTVRVSTAKAELLAEELEQAGCTEAAFERGAGEPVVVFCRFRSDLDAVRKVADAAGLAYGEISGRRNDGLDADSRMAPHVQVCGVQIQAGGTGVDLTRARIGVWYSIGYSVADYDQARSRLVRINQQRPVSFIHLIVPDTVDPVVYDAIDDRRSALAAVLRERGLDPLRLGIRETTPGAPLDSPHGLTVQPHVRLPWDAE
jgi:SNF2-related domain/LAGLIDADG-like domain